MKVHTFNDGNLATESNLVSGVPYFKRLYICLKAIHIFGGMQEGVFG